MNICWIVPAEGAPHRRDVQPQDDRELLSSGYERYRMVRHMNGGGTQQAGIYIHSSVEPTNKHFWKANEELWGLGGAVELYGPDNVRIWP